jgi:kynurenine 3-monooxygenase
VLADCLERHSDDWASALSDYQALRKPNCDAVTELSLRHFAELSHRAGDPRFVVQKHLEQKIHRMYPESFVPLYTQVAFTDAPYVDAHRASEQQVAMLEELMSLPDIETRWDTLEVEGVIHRLIARA